MTALPNMIRHFHAPDLARDEWDRKIEEHTHSFASGDYEQHRHGGYLAGDSYLPEEGE